jgi:hypothetical protein
MPRAEGNASWLDRLNFYRDTAALPRVAEEPDLSRAVREHARYMVHHDTIEHAQTARRWATPDGALAAAVSNLAGSTNAFEPDVWAVDTWMQAPFHALGILDPALRQVGFGIHRAQNGRIQTAAGLDVIRGRHPAQAATVRYPIVWPADGASVPLTTHTHEYPSPLASCDGYTAPTGLPLIVQLGSGTRVPRVIASYVGDGQALEHCVFDEGTYRNRSAAEERLGRSILASRDAIVVIPRQPLRHGAAYRVVLEVAGQPRIDWRFSVSAGGH